MQITPETQQTFRKAFQDRFGECSFKEVDYFLFAKEDRIYKKDGVVLPQVDRKTFPLKDFQIFVPSFELVTKGEDIVVCHSEDEMTLDGDLEVVSKVSGLVLLPRAKGELVCTFGEKDKSGLYVVDKWFLCSKAFYYLWMIMVYDVHPTFQTILKDTTIADLLTILESNVTETSRVADALDKHIYVNMALVARFGLLKNDNPAIHHIYNLFTGNEDFWLSVCNAVGGALNNVVRDVVSKVASSGLCMNLASEKED